MESRRAVEVVVDGGDRGEAGQAFRRVRPHRQFAAELELLAECFASLVDVVGEQRRKRVVAAQLHPQVGIAEPACDRDCATEELERVGIAAVAQREVGGADEHVRGEVRVADLTQQRGGPEDPLTKLRGVLGDEGVVLGGHRAPPFVACDARPVKRLVSQRLGELPVAAAGALLA